MRAWYFDLTLLKGKHKANVHHLLADSNLKYSYQISVIFYYMRMHMERVTRRSLHSTSTVLNFK